MNTGHLCHLDMSMSTLKSLNKKSLHKQPIWSATDSKQQKKIPWGYSIPLSSFKSFISKGKLHGYIVPQMSQEPHFTDSGTQFGYNRVKHIIPLPQPVAPRSLGTSNQMCRPLSHAFQLFSENIF